MNIHKLVVGPVDENTYILEKSGQALIIDPGDEFERINQLIDVLDVEPLVVLLTHTHFDHIGALDEVRDFYGIEAYVHEKEADWIVNPQKNGSIALGNDKPYRAAEHIYDKNAYEFGPFAFKIVETPGHSPGSVSFIFEEDDLVISGDALFRESIGRFDLAGGDFDTLSRSIKTQLYSLPDEYVVYPGHGDSTTIGYEKGHNPFVRA